MIYSGVDLIRNAESSALRAEKINSSAGVRPAKAAQANEREPDQQGALLRFARFVNKERKKKPVSKSSKDAYSKAFAKLRGAEDTGQMLDIYV